MQKIGSSINIIVTRTIRWCSLKHCTMTTSPDPMGLYIGVPLDTIMVYDRNKAMDLHNEEEDFQFVVLEEQQISLTGVVSRSPHDNCISPQRSMWEGVRDSVLGLLMSSVVTTIAIGGYYITVHSPAFLAAGSYPAPPMLLFYAIMLAIWYIGVYAASWSLLERVRQTFMMSPRDTKQQDEETMVRRQFVDTVEWHSNIWNYVGLVLTVVVSCCESAVTTNWHDETNANWKLIPLWALANATAMIPPCSRWRAAGSNEILEEQPGLK